MKRRSVWTTLRSAISTAMRQNPTHGKRPQAAGPWACAGPLLPGGGKAAPLGGRRILCLLGALCVALLLVAPAAAQAQSAPTSDPDSQVWVTNGTVYATAIAPDGTTYIGGEFTHVGPQTGGGAALDAEQRRGRRRFPDSRRHRVRGGPRRRRRLLHRRRLHRVGGITRNNIAHILADGSVDPAFDPNANDRVFALAVSGTTVYAGGTSPRSAARRRNSVAALMPAAASPRPGTRREQLGRGPRRLGLRPSTPAGVHLHRRPDPQLHRRPGCHQRRCHGLEPQRERRGPRPGRLGHDRLRRRRLHHDRRPDPQLHRRPGC